MPTLNDTIEKPDHEQLIDRILERLHRDGQAMYGGEVISQTEHMMQTAMLAERSRAPAPLVAAALMHDIGHLLAAVSEAEDRRHQSAGSQWLAQWFSPAVSEPVRLHVDAKRYLCATDKCYFTTLSPTSVRSLALQGGPMGLDEARAFEAQPFFNEAVALRRWDDAAKVTDIQTSPLDYFRPHLAAALAATAGGFVAG
jgi:gamma-butyrobetaine dioxygenase